MPRVKTGTPLEAPVSSARRGRRGKVSAVVTKRKPRRAPQELIAELKARRAELAETYQERLARLDGRIQRLEARHEKTLKLAELLASKTPEELSVELAAIKKQQQLIKQALKASR